jgi:hypothetical protein
MLDGFLVSCCKCIPGIFGDCYLNAVAAVFLGRGQALFALRLQELELFLFKRQFLAHLLEPSALFVLFHLFQGRVTSLPVVSVLALLGLGIPWSRLLMGVSVLRDIYPSWCVIVQAIIEVSSRLEI